MDFSKANAKDLARIDVDYNTATDDEIVVYLQKKRNGLETKATGERLEVDLIGTAEENGELAPLFEFIDCLNDNERIEVTLRKRFVEKPDE